MHRQLYVSLCRVVLSCLQKQATWQESADNGHVHCQQTAAALSPDSCMKCPGLSYASPDNLLNRLPPPSLGCGWQGHPSKQQVVKFNTANIWAPSYTFCCPKVSLTPAFPHAHVRTYHHPGQPKAWRPGQTRHQCCKKRNHTSSLTGAPWTMEGMVRSLPAPSSAPGAANLRAKVGSSISTSRWDLHAMNDGRLKRQSLLGQTSGASSLSVRGRWRKPTAALDNARTRLRKRAVPRRLSELQGDKQKQGTP